MIGTMNAKADMIPVYDTRSQRPQIAFSEGRITRLFYLPYEGEHRFEIDEGKRRSSWPRLGDESWYVVGWRARIEHTEGENPKVLRIWIGKFD